MSTWASADHLGGEQPLRPSGTLGSQHDVAAACYHARKAMQHGLRLPSKLYPNLNSAANVKVNRDEIATLQPFFFGEYRVTRLHAHGQTLPNSKFVFVTAADGAILMHPRYRHPVLAEGRAVRYAGEAQFRHGKLEWWSNASGNYRPDPRHAMQAGLPMEQFYTFEQVRSGIQPLKTLKFVSKP